jgi:hypothetical protein
MAEYRKKPVIIQAFKLYTDPMPDWFMNAVSEKAVMLVSTNSIPTSCLIHTLEGEMVGQSGDYIIQGVEDEIYPCKPDIFQATYEAV